MRTSRSSIHPARKCYYTVRRFPSAYGLSPSQVNVQGSGTQQPPSSDLVSIPGVYDNVKFPDIWDDNFHSFTLPAPPVAFASGGTSTPSSSPSPAESSSTHSSSSAATSHASAPTSTSVLAQPPASSSVVSAPPSAGTGKCKASSIAQPSASSSSASASAATSSSSPPKCKPRSRLMKRRSSVSSAQHMVRRHAHVARAKRH